MKVGRLAQELDRYTYRYKGKDSCDGCTKQQDGGKGCAEDVHLSEDEFGNVPFCVWRVSS